MSDNLSVCRPGSDCDALVSVSEMLKYKRHDISLINSCFIIIVINDNTATEPCMLSVTRKQNGDDMSWRAFPEKNMSGKKMSMYGSGGGGSEELIPS